MNHGKKHVMLHRFGAAVLLASVCASASAVNDAPLTEKWAPSVWGAEDMAGSVNWTTEAVGPGFGGENKQPFECHMNMMTKRGIWNLENLDFSQLLADNVTEFLFVWSPLKMKGATGSPGNPVALY